MSKRMRTGLLAGLLAVALTTMSVGAALAAPAQGQSCRAITGKGAGQVNLTTGFTEATITGAGILNGTTLGKLTQEAPVKGIVHFKGTLTFTTGGGTLTLTVKGGVDTRNGRFAGRGPVTGATGALAGAKGAFAFVGTQNLVTSPFAFSERLIGVLCR